MIRRVRFPVVAVLVAGALGAPPTWANHGAPISSFGTNGTSIVDLAGGGEAINDLVATTVPIRAPAPSGFPCTTKDCTIVIGFRTVLLGNGALAAAAILACAALQPDTPEVLAAAILFAIVPGRALRRLPVAFEDPVAELAANRQHAAEESGIA